MDFKVLILPLFSGLLPDIDPKVYSSQFSLIHQKELFKAMENTSPLPTQKQISKLIWELGWEIPKLENFFSRFQKLPPSASGKKIFKF